MREVSDWLTLYSRRRRHSTLGYIDPTWFENNWPFAQLQIAA